MKYLPSWLPESKLLSPSSRQEKPPSFFFKLSLLFVSFSPTKAGVLLRLSFFYKPTYARYSKANIISLKHYHVPIFKNKYNVTLEFMHRNKTPFYVRTQYNYFKDLSFTEPCQGILQEHHSEETKTNITREDKKTSLCDGLPSPPETNSLFSRF